MSAWILIFSILFGVLVMYLAWCYCCVHQSRSTQSRKCKKFEQAEAQWLAKRELKSLASTPSNPTAGAPSPAHSDTVVSIPPLQQIDVPDSVPEPQKSPNTPGQLFEVAGETKAQQFVSDTVKLEDAAAGDGCFAPGIVIAMHHEYPRNEPGWRIMDYPDLPGNSERVVTMKSVSTSTADDQDLLLGVDDISSNKSKRLEESDTPS